MHGPGVVGEHGGELRDISRSGGAEGDFGTHPRPREGGASRAGRRGIRRRGGTLLRYLHRGRVVEGHDERGGSGGGRRRGRERARDRRRDRGNLHGRGHHARRRIGPALGSVRHPRPGRVRRREPHGGGRLRGPRDRHPLPSHLPPASLRDADAALPQSARKSRPGIEPLHDIARIVHDEAQRDRGDDPRDVAGLLRHPPLRAPRSGEGISRDDRGSQ
mmetsp:Transcript_33850/g.81842  ORF Transcript_33850/g.81842 Transcript_33850/m.81842 type:complete len:218 (-) Transcript_33850:1386-2039(-)